MKVQSVVSLIESAYGVVPSTHGWLENLAKVGAAALESNQGAFVFQYDVAARDWVHPGAAAFHGLSPDFVRDFFDRRDVPPEIARGMAREFRSARLRTFRALAERLGVGEYLGGSLDRHGIGDLVCINGLDPSGHGCMLCVADRRRSYAQKTVRLWQRMAAHISAGNRLRRTLGGVASAGTSRVDNAEAVLTPEGKIEHAQGPADSRAAREALRDALVRIDAARSERDDTSRAVELWRALTLGRWSLVEHFESDGRRYYLAHKNDPELAADRTLTARERQVLGYAELGHSNKLIAYELGLSTSTVSALLARARGRRGKG